MDKLKELHHSRVIKGYRVDDNKIIIRFHTGEEIEIEAVLRYNRFTNYPEAKLIVE